MSLFQKPKTLQDALNLVDKSHAMYEARLKKRADELSMTKDRQDIFKAIVGRCRLQGELRCGDLKASKRYAREIVKEVHLLSRANPRLKFFFITALADEGITSDRTPAIALAPLRGKADRALRRHIKVDGIHRVEITPLMNWPRKGDGRTLLSHVHALVWHDPSLKDGVHLSAEDIASNMRCQNSPWSSRFGAEPVVVRMITPEMGTPAYWAAYMLKAPYEAKNLMKRKGNDIRRSTFKFMSTTSGYRPELAMRVHEVLHQIPLFSSIGGVGAGAAMLRRARSWVKAWDKRRKARSHISSKALRRFWQRTHRLRRKTYGPIFINGETVVDE